MRIFLMLLMIAIGFNGYISVAHAFAEDIAHDVTSLNLSDDQHSQKNGHNSDKKSDTNCNDCAHCCVAQVFMISDYSVNHLSPTIGWVSPLNDDHRDRYAGSLFRPPIALI
jgi:hypothetical protein